MELGIQFALQIILTVVIIRLVTRPLRQLARVAERLPPDLPEEALDELPSSGAREVAQTSQALKAMLARIRHFVDERMRLLACLSHDLRTTRSGICRISRKAPLNWHAPGRTGNPCGAPV